MGFGGQAGGGKSYLALGLAATQHRRSTIYRLHRDDLQDLIDDGDRMFLEAGVQCAYNSLRRRWETPDGRFINMQAIEKVKDIRKYKGRARDLLVFDEAQEFPELVVRFLDGWRRTTNPNQRTRLVLTFNPPTDETGEWLIQFFAPWLDADHENPAEPGELRWYVRYKDEDTAVPGPGFYDEFDGVLQLVDRTSDYEAESRTFYPASIDDNPYLSRTDYKKRLSNLPEPLRSQLLFGDFTIGKSDDAWQVFPTDHLDAARERWQGMEPPEALMRGLGIDVARGGPDNTVLAPLFANWFSEMVIKPGRETPDGDSILDLVLLLLGEDDAYIEHPPAIGIDITGVGSSPYDAVRKHYAGRVVYAFNGSKAVKARDKTGKFGFFNLRAYSTWLLKEALDPDSGENIALPPSRTLRNDLRALRYRVRSGKYIIEEKEEIKKRIGRSPDEGDAAIIAWYVSQMIQHKDWAI